MAMLNNQRVLLDNWTEFEQDIWTGENYLRWDTKKNISITIIELFWIKEQDKHGIQEKMGIWMGFILW